MTKNGPFRSGLNPFTNSGPLPMIGQSLDREQEAKRAIMQQVGQMSQSMFMQIVARRLGHAGSPDPDFAAIAKQSQEAAKAYFESFGMKFESIPDKAADEGASTNENA